MSDVTSAEIMKAAGIRDISTLTRWHKMELIPAPEVRLHPRGRGKIGYWPDWVLKRCLRIKQLQRAGKTLDEIREFLGTNWEEEAQQSKRRYRFSEASARLEREAARENLTQMVEFTLRDWMVGQRRRLRSTKVPLIASTVVDNAIAMIEDGINPVLVIDDDSLYVMADFAVSHQLAQRYSARFPLLVIPIFDELESYFRARQALPKKPVVRPAEMVVDAEGRLCHVVIMEGGKFEIEPPKRRRKR